MAALAQHAAGVRVIHHQAGAVPLYHLYYLGQGADIALHGENAVHDDEPAVPGPYFLKYAVQVGRVVVFEAAQFALGKPAAV